MEINALTAVHTILILGIVLVVASIPYLNHTIKELKQRNAESRKELCGEIGPPGVCLAGAPEEGEVGQGQSKVAKDERR